MANFDVVFLHPPAWVSRQRLGKLLNVFRGKRRLNEYPIMPVGVFSLASCLDKEGFQTKIINLGLEQCLDPSFNLDKKIKSTVADIYAIDLHCRYIRAERWKSRIYVRGITLIAL